ncbi:MAG: acetylglutamate/LysW-gamma-L-alpha-aminoadipate kinase [Planctomycetota bacterium]|jgi:acetylglutamate/LysW-gamma-L-alpha-aminoadipate kinase
MNELHVIKLGGAEGNDLNAVAADVAQLWHAGKRLLLVHGGSSEATQLGQALGHPARFAESPSGHTSRLTDAKTLDVFLMATALMNRRLVAALAALKVPAVGLSGLDGSCLKADQKKAFRVVEDGRVRVVRGDLSGRPSGVNTDLLRLLLEGGYLPVLAPVGTTEAGQALNVDGDRAAACIAGAMGAASLSLLTAVAGLLRDRHDPSSLVTRIGAHELEQAMQMAEGSMKKKVLAVGEALEGGVPQVVIAPSYGEHPVERALAGAGTCFGALEVTR